MAENGVVTQSLGSTQAVSRSCTVMLNRVATFLQLLVPGKQRIQTSLQCCWVLKTYISVPSQLLGDVEMSRQGFTPWWSMRRRCLRQSYVNIMMYMRPAFSYMSYGELGQGMLIGCEASFLKLTLQAGKGRGCSVEQEAQDVLDIFTLNSKKQSVYSHGHRATVLERGTHNVLNPLVLPCCCRLLSNSERIIFMHSQTFDASPKIMFVGPLNEQTYASILR